MMQAFSCEPCGPCCATDEVTCTGTSVADAAVSRDDVFIEKQTGASSWSCGLLCCDSFPSGSPFYAGVNTFCSSGTRFALIEAKWDSRIMI